MSSLGPIQYEEPEGSVFLGRDYTKSKFTSDALSNEIDTEVRKRRHHQFYFRGSRWFEMVVLV